MQPSTVTTTPSLALLGCGYTLTRVAASLPSDSVVATSRSEAGVKNLHARGFTAVQLSAESEADLTHLAGAYRPRVIVDGIPPLAGDDPALFARSVAHWANDISVERLIYLSTTGVFGETSGAWVDETTPAHPATPQGAARLAVEQAYRGILGARLTVLRVPAIYGPGRGIGCALRDGRYKLIGDGSQWSNRIQVEDLASIIIAAIDAPELPPLLCIADDEPARASDVVEFYCSRFALPAPEIVTRAAAEARGSFTLLSNQRVSSALVKRTLGITLQFPSYREGAATEFSRLE